MYQNNAQYLQGVYKDATTPTFGYLFIDMKQETQENLRSCTNILKIQTAGLIYVPVGAKVNEISSQDISPTYCDDPSDKKQ